MEFAVGGENLFNLLGAFVFLYPFIMSIVWIVGTIIFSASQEKNEELNIEEYEWPAVSILVPCYNEEDTVEETIEYLSRLDYPEYEIIAINDGSTDRTGEILVRLAEKYDRLRVIDCHENKGKANALHMGAHASRHEYLICIDSDAILNEMAPYYLVRHFIQNGERVGAVTGNPRIRNRDTLLGKIQLVEYASVVGAIKRTQRVIGKVMTVSGVVVAFRKKALVSVGLWDRDMITEDIAVSWKLEKKFWDIRYEPNALCWMLVPETLTGLWKQRVRWAQGGQEVVLRHWDIFKDWRQRRLWIIYTEQIISTIWSICWLIEMGYIILGSQMAAELMIWMSISAFALGMMSLIQLYVALKSDASYDNVMKYYLWAAWYPTIYWIFNVFVVIAAIPKSIKSRIRGGYAVWNSPDRGKRKTIEVKNI